LAFGTLKNMASTGVFVLLVCALNSVNNGFHCTPSMLLTHRRDVQSCSSQKCGPSRKFHRARWCKCKNSQISIPRCKNCP